MSSASATPASGAGPPGAGPQGAGRADDGESGGASERRVPTKFPADGGAKTVDFEGRSTKSVAAARAVPMRVGKAAPKPGSSRADNVASTPTAPTAASAPRAAAKERVANRPTRIAVTPRTVSSPTIKTALSAEPKVLIAHSRTDAGTRSITRSAAAWIGPRNSLDKAAVTSPAPSPTIPALRPAKAEALGERPLIAWPLGNGAPGGSARDIAVMLSALPRRQRRALRRPKTPGTASRLSVGRPSPSSR